MKTAFKKLAQVLAIMVATFIATIVLLVYLGIREMQKTNQHPAQHHSRGVRQWKA